MDPMSLRPGQEQHREFWSDIRNIALVQYDYRQEDGKLFSCIRFTLEQCREARDKWLGVYQEPVLRLGGNMIEVPITKEVNNEG